MKAIKYTIILTIAAFSFYSCTKEEAGPAGPQGNTGATGASSSYSVVIDSFSTSQWKYNGTTYNATIPNIYALTSPSTSIVEVYCATSNNSNTTWNELPAFNAFSVGDMVTCSYYIYNVVIEYDFTSAPAQMTWYKVVVINQP